jgi:hypothetical protein
MLRARRFRNAALGDQLFCYGFRRVSVQRSRGACVCVCVCVCVPFFLRPSADALLNSGQAHI